MTQEETKWSVHHLKVTETQGYLCDIHTKKSGTAPLRKEAKRCGIPHKIRVMYERKGNNKEVYI